MQSMDVKAEQAGIVPRLQWLSWAWSGERVSIIRGDGDREMKCIRTSKLFIWLVLLWKQMSLRLVQ